MAGTLFAVVAGVLFYSIRDGHVETENLFMPGKLKCIFLFSKFSIDLLFTYIHCFSLVTTCTSNSMPFDRSTVNGYTGFLLSGLILGLNYMIITATIASLFLSMGLYLRAFYLHYELMFRHMNELVDRKIPEAAKWIQLKACLIEAIKFHNQAKE